MRAMEFAVFLLGLLFMAPQYSFQMSLRNPFRETSFLGLVLSTQANEKSLWDSGRFTPYVGYGYTNPVEIAGRKYHMGTINNSNIPVVYVVANDPAVNGAIATQVLISNFNARGIVHLGTAGSIDDESLNLGDVAVLESVDFLDYWIWKNQSGAGELTFRDYNFPQNGDNLLGSLDFEIVTLFAQGKPPVHDNPWLPVDPDYLEIAKSFESESYKLVFGLKGASSGAYLSNAAYGEFLHSRFGVSTVDTVSAAVAMTSLSNGKPFIQFRGISGSVKSGTKSVGASKNAVLAATDFIAVLGSTPRMVLQSVM